MGFSDGSLSLFHGCLFVGDVCCDIGGAFGQPCSFPFGVLSFLSVDFDDSLLGVCRRLNGVFEQLCFKIDGFAGRDIVVSGRFLVIALCWTWNLRFLCCGGA